MPEATVQYFYRNDAGGLVATNEQGYADAFNRGRPVFMACDPIDPADPDEPADWTGWQEIGAVDDRSGGGAVAAMRESVRVASSFERAARQVRVAFEGPTVMLLALREVGGASVAPYGTPLDSPAWIPAPGVAEALNEALNAHNDRRSVSDA